MHRGNDAGGRMSIGVDEGACSPGETWAAPVAVDSYGTSEVGRTPDHIRAGHWHANEHSNTAVKGLQGEI